MATCPSLASPTSQIRRHLAAATKAGVDFEEAWAEATDAALQDLWTYDRKDWQPVLDASGEGWRRAYEDEDALPCEAAAALLAEAEPLPEGQEAVGVPAELLG